ncbi:MAG TPA: DUF1559 domain-containing protein [Pirellulales bacterium]|jgi:hypothetical protein|nr:DUF1559 domain-containing protein [Pirellulales bacterium]
MPAFKRVTIRRVLLSVLWVASFIMVGLVYCTVEAMVGPNCARAISARRLQCANALKLISLAMCNYEAQDNCKMPAYSRTPSGLRGLSWRVLIGRLMDSSWPGQFDSKETWDSAGNAHLPNHVPSDFVCPCRSDSAGRAGSSNVAVIGEEFDDSNRAPDIIGVLETESKVPWTKPAYLRISEIAQAVKDNYGCENGFHLLLANGEIHYFLRGSDVSDIAETLRSAVGKPYEDSQRPVFHR